MLTSAFPLQQQLLVVPGSTETIEFSVDGTSIQFFETPWEALEVAVRGTSNRALIVLPEDQLSCDFLESFLAAGKTRSVGILPVDNGANWRDAVAASRMTHNYEKPILAYTAFQQHSVGPLLGMEQTAEFFAQAEVGAQVLVVNAHGNGADFLCGARVICVHADQFRPLPTERQRSLPCNNGGPCIREPQAFDDFVGASRLRCAAAILLSCSGLRPADGAIGHGATMASALLRAGVSCVVASTLDHHAGVSQIAWACRALATGATLGEIADELNARTLVPSYLCLGDPTLALKPLVRRARPGSGEQPRATHGLTAEGRAARRVSAKVRDAQQRLEKLAPSCEGHLASSEFTRRTLIAFLAQLRATGRRFPPRQLSANAFSRLLLLSADDLTEETLRFLAESVADGWWPHKGWQSLVADSLEEPAGRHVCGAQMCRLSGRFDKSKLWRSVFFCRRCGYVLDTEGEEFDFSLVAVRQEGAIQIHARGPEGRLMVAPEPVGPLREPVIACDRMSGEGMGRKIRWVPAHSVPGVRWLCLIHVGPGESFRIARAPIVTDQTCSASIEDVTPFCGSAQIPVPRLIRGSRDYGQG